MIPTVVGLDLSLTCTGVVRAGGGSLTISRIRPEHMGGERIEEQKALIWDAVQGADLVVLEGQFPAAGVGQHALFGFWWIIRHEVLWRSGSRVAIVAPASAKVYACNNGRASKSEVFNEMRARFPRERIVDDNQADALALACIGLRWLCAPIDNVPQGNLRGMANIDWPARPEWAPDFKLDLPESKTRKVRPQKKTRKAPGGDPFVVGQLPL